MPRTTAGRLSLGVAAVGILALVGVLARSDAQWFPQQYAHEFYLAKGVVGVVAVVLLVTHMAQAWPYIDSADQQLRYLALLVGTTAAGSASTTQFSSDAAVAGVNITGLLFVLIVAVAMVASLLADARRRRP